MAAVALRVAVAGATGRTGSEAAKAIRQAADLQLVAAVARGRAGQDLGTLLGEGAWGIPVETDLGDALARTRPDVLVDFTLGESAGGHALLALGRGVRPVVGATGLPAADLDAIRRQSRESGLGAVVIPNFSFGILLLSRFCGQALRFFPDVEIVEAHHATKRDRPSGTARLLRRVLEEAGAKSPVPIHSVRLPGLVAHHEVVFGGPGETLTVRHDTTSRASFGPGVVLAVRRVMALTGLVEDIETLLSSD
jgi:4-hydroxy-tetrahydrodipicolinate reductase